MPDEARRVASPLSLWDRALDLVFPPRCVACRSFGSFLCGRCLADCVRALPPRCAICWNRTHQEMCYSCADARPAFIAARSSFAYGGPARDAVHALKFDGLSAVARPMAELMARTLLDWAPPVEAIVPVPLAGARRRQRGYDQADLLARHISRATGIPLAAGMLRRTRSTGAQTQQRDEDSRRRNVAGAFALGRTSARDCVLLIDDVLTTGSTLDACARVLLEGRAQGVYALTFARED